MKHAVLTFTIIVLAATAASQAAELKLAAVLPAPATPSASPSPRVYAEFLRDQAAGTSSLLPDYSWAGYRFGAAAIPDVQGRVFNVDDYGAKADDEVEDREQIQAAIHAAENAGGGIVFFPPGRYLLNEQPDRQDGIVIAKPGIILRGSGAGPGGSELFMKHYLLPRDPEKKWTVPAMFTFKPAQGMRQKTLTRVTNDAPRDARTIVVEAAAAIQVGDMIQLCLRNPAANPALLGGLEPWPTWRETVNRGVRIAETHQVISKQGNVLTLAEPLRTAITAAHGWAVRTHASVDGWAVEDLWFRGNFQEKFVHHKNFIHDAGWSFLRLGSPRHAWVRRIRLTDVNAGINITNGYACSVLLIRFDGNCGHFTTAAEGSYGVLMGLIDDATRTGMWHGPGVSGSSAGCVIWRYHGQAKSGPDFHASWPYYNLYDASSSGLVGNGGNVKLLPNHLRDLTYWNICELGKPYVNYDFWDSPPANTAVDYSGVKIVLPNLIGLHGAGSTFVREHVGCLESPGQPVAPESLYEAQLSLRLGRTPAWLEAAKAERTRAQTGSHRGNE